MEQVLHLNTQKKESPSMSSVKQFVRPILCGIPPRYADKNFDSYKTDQNNQKQFDICKGDFESIVLTGKSGTGKTHLAISILKNIEPVPLIERDYKIVRENYEQQIRLFKEHNPYKLTKEKVEYIEKYLEYECYKYRQPVCLFLPAIKFFMQANYLSMNGGDKEEYFENLTRIPSTRTQYDSCSVSKGYDVVCLDDLGAEKLTEATRQNLYYFIDERYRNMMRTIITTNFTIEQINEIEPRVASRLAEMGKIVLFNGKDYRVNLN